MSKPKKPRKATIIRVNEFRGFMPVTIHYVYVDGKQQNVFDKYSEAKEYINEMGFVLDTILNNQEEI